VDRSPGGAEDHADERDGEARSEPGEPASDEGAAEEPGRSGHDAAPALVPPRAPVRERRLPAPARSTVRPPSRTDPTVVLGTVVPGAADATQVMSAEEAERVRRHGAEASALFSGSAEAEARAGLFHGPGKEAIEEREQTAERHLTGEVEVEEPRRRRVAPDSWEGGPTRGPGESDGGDGEG
jgi:hypothetical protein